MTERLFGSHQRKPKGITLAEWPQKPSGLSTAALQPVAKLGEQAVPLNDVLHPFY